MNQNNGAAPRWNLDTIFSGGSKSPQFKSYREKFKQELAKLNEKFSQMAAKTELLTKDEIVDLVEGLQKAHDKLELIYSFAGCLMSADVKDDTAYEIYSESQGYESQWDNLKTLLESFTLKMTEEDWKALLEDARVKRVSFYLNEMRELARVKMPPRMESLALDLAVNGYHAWNNIYTKMAGDSTVQYNENGQTTELSLGQLALKMSDPKRDVRKTAFEKLTQAWQANSNLASLVLNSQAGFRLSLYKQRGWKSALYEPLKMGRLKEETLNAMWSAVLDGAEKLKPYVDAKKKILGIDKFCWYDQIAPVGKASKVYTYDEASKFIIEQIGGFSPDMQKFVIHALKNNWVEAENRSGKAAGGFCTGFGEVKESRIFMTFENSYDSLLTLAHELGHAYHHHVLKDDPAFATSYPMGLAETASTFNELLVTDAALAQVADDQEKLMLIDQKLGNALTMFCNIHARFIFDKNFYSERAKGLVNKKRLNEMMTEAQKTAFCGMLDPNEGYHPEFWASKLHFFETSYPFYNFPYTFGFLFSTAVYNKAKDEGAGFADKYRAFLYDTGVMTSEEIAKKHLDFDLTDPKFWQWVVERVLEDVLPFVKLAEESK